MKLNPIQIAASACGAVASAVIASTFGVKGTVIGVAIGSIVATSASALVGDWIDRTHKAVRQVVVKGGGPVPFLHRGPRTEPSGTVTGAASESSAVDVSVSSPAAGRGDTGAAGTAGGDRAAPGGAPGGAPAGDRAAPEAADGTGAGARRETGDVRFVASSRTGSAAARLGRLGDSGGPGRARRRSSWRAVALSAAVVFAVALAAVTVVELVAGQPLSSLIGANPSTGGTSAGNLFRPTPPTTTSSTTTTTTSTTTTTTTTTTTVPPSTTTTTTPSTTTTTTVPASTTTVPAAGTGAGTGAASGAGAGAGGTPKG